MNLTPGPLWVSAQLVTHNSAADVTLQVDGQPIPARASDTVATALLRAGYTHFGISTTTGRPLAATCMMGVCFGCLCTIDDRPGSQACLEPVRNGMRVSIDPMPETDGT